MRLVISSFSSASWIVIFSSSLFILVFVIVYSFSCNKLSISLIDDSLFIVILVPPVKSTPRLAPDVKNMITPVTYKIIDIRLNLFLCLIKFSF